MDGSTRRVDRLPEAALAGRRDSSASMTTSRRISPRYRDRQGAASWPRAAGCSLQARIPPNSRVNVRPIPDRPIPAPSNRPVLIQREWENRPRSLSHAPVPYCWSCAAERVTALSSCTRRSDDADARHSQARKESTWSTPKLAHVSKRRRTVVNPARPATRAILTGTVFG